MGHETQQIEAHIENTREQLGSNLQELERKVKSVTDWKQHFQSNPMVFIGAAVGGGALLSAMLGGGKRKGRNSHNAYALASASEGSSNGGARREKAVETWDNIKGALIGVAATRFTDYVGQIVPGFQEHFERRKSSTSTE